MGHVCFRGEVNLQDSLGGGDFKDVCLLNFDPHPPVFGPWKVKSR